MPRRFAHALIPGLLAVAAGAAQAGLVVDNFESGLPFNLDANGNPVGFLPFAGGPASVFVSTTSAPVAVPGAAAGNQVMRADLAVGGPPGSGFAGIARFLSNPSTDTWVSQDWSAYNALRFWMYGQATGTELFVDIIDNRNAGSTVEDAERFVTTLFDDFSGWREVTLDFSSFTRKDIGNGAPDDGLGLTEVHGWAFGSLTTPGGASVSYYIDDVSVVSVVPAPSTLLLLATALVGLRRMGRSASAARATA